MLSLLTILKNIKLHICLILENPVKLFFKMEDMHKIKENCMKGEVY